MLFPVQEKMFSQNLNCYDGLLHCSTCEILFFFFNIIASFYLGERGVQTRKIMSSQPNIVLIISIKFR